MLLLLVVLPLFRLPVPGVTAAPRCAMDVVGVCATDALSSSCFPVGVVVLFVSLWTASVVRHLHLLERCPVAIECAVCAVPVWLLKFVVCVSPPGVVVVGPSAVVCSRPRSARAVAVASTTAASGSTFAGRRRRQWPWR